MSYIWSCEQLRAFLKHPQADLRNWAAAGLFAMYPVEALGELEALLLSRDDSLVLPVLSFLRGHRKDGVAGHLRRLFLRESEAVSRKVLEVAIAWQLTDAVQWIKEKIGSRERLSPEQVDAMIVALGKICDEESYHLLKVTEQGVKMRASAFYERYYSALLAHRKPEDLDTLLTDAFNEGNRERTRIAALSVVLWEVNPSLRASDVFFANHTWINRQLSMDARRLLETASEQEADEIRRIPATLESLKVETVSDQLPEIAALVKADGGAGDWLSLVAGKAAAFLTRPEQAPETLYAEAIVVLASLLARLEQKIAMSDDRDADWRTSLIHLFRSRPIDVDHDPVWCSLLERAEPSELTAALEAIVRECPTILAQFNAAMALGKLQATASVPSLFAAIEENHSKDFEEILRLALGRMGPAAVPELLERLKVCRPELRPLILKTCSHYPTPEVVRVFLEHLEDFYRGDPEAALQALARIGAKELVPFLEREVREGEESLETAYLRVCRVNGIESERLAEVERDLKRLTKLNAAAPEMSYQDAESFPTFLNLRLACRHCKKTYRYQVHTVHMHPPAPEPLQERYQKDLTAYRQGMVIVDSLVCKNCGTWNDFSLSEESLAEISAHSLRLSVVKQAKVEVPSAYPLQYVSYQEKDGKSLSLLEIEQELQSRLLAGPKQPQSHLALGKFYEYVKVLDEAKRSYLTALNLDSACLEAMAGLARLAELQVRYREAYEWCQRCFENLATGHVFLVDSFEDFKKAVREKRREYARRAGIKPEQETVEIRFRIEPATYPKNKPCPCGSGKKYKMCCMNKEQPWREANR